MMRRAGPGSNRTHAKQYTDNVVDLMLGKLVMPLAVWLWIGGGLMAVGTVLSGVAGSSSPADRSRVGTDPRAPRADTATAEETVGEPVGAGVDG